jgi:HEAT repeat protein
MWKKNSIVLVFIFCTVCVFSQSKHEWERIKSQNSISLCENFLKKYPNGKFKNLAVEQLEELRVDSAWRSTNSIGSLGAFKTFIVKYPKSKYSDQAEKVKEKLEITHDWETAKSVNSISVYTEYIAKHPVSIYTEKAKEQLKTLQVEAALHDGGKGKIDSATFVMVINDLIRYTATHSFNWQSSNLIKIGKPAIVPLCTYLHDSDTKIRNIAVLVLGEIGDSTAIKPLIACLNDNDYNVRENTANALDKMSFVPTSQTEKISYFIAAKKFDELTKIGKPAIKPLIVCLKDHNRQIRESALYTLEKMEYKPSSEGDLISYLIVSRQYDNIIRIGKPAIEPLIDCLYYKDGEFDYDIENTLSAIGKPAIEPLIVHLNDINVNVRQHSVLALGRIGDRHATIPLIKCLKDTVFVIRSSAAEALGKIGDSHAIQPLIDYLKEACDLSAIYALGKFGAQDAVVPLIACLKHNNDIVGQEAAEALGKIGDRKAIPFLVSALPNWENARSYSISLKSMNWQPITDDEQIHWWIAIRDTSELISHWNQTKRVLLDDLNSTDFLRNEYAVYAFISFGSADVKVQLINILNTKGNKKMAETFLNSGDNSLSEIAKTWASNHGYIISSDGTKPEAKWGKW